MNRLPCIEDFDNNFKDYLFYDFEVFKKDLFVVFKDINKNTHSVIHLGGENKGNISDLIEIVQNYILVGYNNYGYDDLVLSKIIYDINSGYSQSKIIKDIKYLNDHIIYGSAYPDKIRLKTDLVSLDCYQQMNVSLKKIEANIGLSIKETDIPFDIERELTGAECELVEKYCKTDVNATIDVFKLRWYSYFEPKIRLLDFIKIEDRGRAIRWNTTTITANILIDKPKTRFWSKPRLTSSTSAKEIDRVQNEKLSIFSPTLRSRLEEMWFPKVNQKHTPKKVTIKEFGCKLTFGSGGLHGAPEKFVDEQDIVLLDVASMYPNILIHLNALGENTSVYRGIVDDRVRVKHTDPRLANALKLIINSTYGLLKNKHSKLFHPHAAESVCIYGQIALYELCKELDKWDYKIININTDGVAFVRTSANNTDKYKDVAREWEEKYKLTLEESYFKKWIQKDVNNYIAVTDNGKLKLKGGDVKHYNNPTDFEGDLFELSAGEAWNNTNSMQIVTKCVVDYLLGKDDDIERIIYKYLDKPTLFQVILSPGQTYKGIIDNEGNTNYQKVNRVFATKEGVCLRKFKVDEGQIRKANFADAPSNMFIHNEHIKDIDDLKNVIDREFYIEKSKTILDRWK